MVEMFDSCWSTNDWEFQDLLNVLCARTVCVCCLNNANSKFVRDTCVACEVVDERGGKRGDAIPVKELEDISIVEVVVYYSIGITVQRSTTVMNRRLG